MPVGLLREWKEGKKSPGKDLFCNQGLPHLMPWFYKDRAVHYLRSTPRLFCLVDFH